MSAAPPVYAAALEFPYAWLGLVVQDAALVSLDFLDQAPPVAAQPCALAARAVAQLQAYLRDPSQSFDLPLRPPGSPYQQRVWAALRDIPPGETRSYGQLAHALGSGPRAVGGACRANPIPIIIPCHRVLAAHGRLGGYMGQTSASGGHGLDYKRWLLRHEGWLGADLQGQRNLPRKHDYVERLQDWPWSSFTATSKLRELFEQHREYRTLIIPEDDI